MGISPNQKRCIVCDSGTVQQFLGLGETALANKFLAKEELSVPETMYPLRVGFCHSCGHVQLMEGVPPSVMFEDYLYISSALPPLPRSAMPKTAYARLHDACARALSLSLVPTMGTRPFHEHCSSVRYVCLSIFDLTDSGK